VFIEVGAFNGDFSRRLAAAFPRAAITASDLVKVAWENAAANEPFPPSVVFDWCDMFDYRLPMSFDQKPAILLLLECIYYMPIADREEAIAGLLRRFPKVRLVFVSGPMGGTDDYLTEEWLIRRFKKERARLVGVRQLNLGVAKDFGFWRTLWRRLSRKSLKPGQAIFAFQR
jgi:hypothetical protein